MESVKLENFAGRLTTDVTRLESAVTMESAVTGPGATRLRTDAMNNVIILRQLAAMRFQEQTRIGVTTTIVVAHPAAV